MTIRHIVVDQFNRIHDVSDMYDEEGIATTNPLKAQSAIALIDGKAWQVFSLENVDIHTVQ